MSSREETIETAVQSFVPNLELATLLLPMTIRSVDINGIGHFVDGNYSQSGTLNEETILIIGLIKNNITPNWQRTAAHLDQRRV